MSKSQSLIKSRPILLSHLLAAILLFSVFSPAADSAQSNPASPDLSKTGTLSDLHSDKRVVQNGRWFLVREFTVDFSVKDGTQMYCGEIVTTDATEAYDLMNSGGQPVEVSEKGKDITLTLKDGRRVKAHRLNLDKCPRA